MGKIIEDAWAESKKDGYTNIEFKSDGYVVPIALSEYDRICEDLKAGKEWIEVATTLGQEILIRASEIAEVVYCGKEYATLKEQDRQEELIKGER